MMPLDLLSSYSQFLLSVEKHKPLTKAIQFFKAPNKIPECVNIRMWEYIKKATHYVIDKEIFILYKY